MCFFAHMQSENRELPNKCETSPSWTRMQTAISEITTVHKRLCHSDVSININDGEIKILNSGKT